MQVGQVHATCTAKELCEIPDALISQKLMALVPVPLPQFSASSIFQTRLNSFSRPCLSAKNTFPKHLVITSRANTQKESAKVRNWRLQRKGRGTVVTGRVEQETIKVGEDVEILGLMQAGDNVGLLLRCLKWGDVQ